MRRAATFAQVSPTWRLAWLTGGAGTLLLLICLAALPGSFSLAHAAGVAGAALLLLALFVEQQPRKEAHRVEEIDRLYLLGDRLETRLEELQDLRWELSENSTRYRELLDAQEDLIVRLDPAGCLTFVNRSFCRAFGVAEDEALGRPFAPLVLEEISDGPWRKDASGRSRRLDQRLMIGGEERWIEWEEHELAPGDDGRVEVQRVGRDVTEARRRADELREARNGAEAASRAKSRFLAAMSHEIRTPMNGILGMTGLLLDTAQTPEQQTYTRAIDQSARTLLTLIDEILDFSKIEAGKLTLTEAPFSPVACLQQTAELMAPRAHEKGLELAWSEAGGIPAQIAGDEARFRQILLNLVSNAIKFTDKGGIEIVLSGEPEGDGRLRLMIRVRDTGIGMSEAELASLFGEFEQSGAAQSRQSGGTGLGLAISRRLAMAMDGDITVSANPGAGSIFTVILRMALADAPAAERDRPAGIALPAPGELPAPPGRVLLATGQPMERAAMYAVLQQAGLDAVATTFRDAHAALVAGARDGRPFDRILVDSETSAVHAGELLAEACRLAPQSRVKGIICINALARSSLATFRAEGFAAYLVRPVRPSALLQQLALPGSSPGAPPAPASRVERPAGTLAAEGGSRGLVLLAEDNEINALLASKVITRLGWEIATCRSGTEAVAHMEAALTGALRVPDVILMDIFMPGMDGVEATRLIRRLYAQATAVGAPAGDRPRLSCPPIVALTANAFPEDRDRLLAAGLDGYLAKPFEVSALSALLDAAARRELPALAAPPAPTDASAA